MAKVRLLTETRTVYEKRFTYHKSGRHYGDPPVERVGAEYATLNTIRNFCKILNYIIDNWDTVEKNGFTAKQAGVTGNTMIPACRYGREIFRYNLIIEKSEPKIYVNVDDPEDRITIRRSVAKNKYYPTAKYEDYLNCLNAIKAEIAKGV